MEHSRALLHVERIACISCANYLCTAWRTWRLPCGAALWVCEDCDVTAGGRWLVCRCASHSHGVCGVGRWGLRASGPRRRAPSARRARPNDAGARTRAEAVAEPSVWGACTPAQGTQESLWGRQQSPTPAAAPARDPARPLHLRCVAFRSDSRRRSRVRRRAPLARVKHEGPGGERMVPANVKIYDIPTV